MEFYSGRPYALLAGLYN